MTERTITPKTNFKNLDQLKPLNFYGLPYAFSDADGEHLPTEKEPFYIRIEDKHNIDWELEHPNRQLELQRNFINNLTCTAILLFTGPDTDRNTTFVIDGHEVIHAPLRLVKDFDTNDKDLLEHILKQPDYNHKTLKGFIEDILKPYFN